MDFLEYVKAVKEERGDLTSGRLKLTNTQIIFKNHKTGKIDTLNSGEIKKIGWQRLADNYAIRVMLKNGHLYRYGGLKMFDKEKLENFVQSNYSLTLDTQEFSIRGWNWGTASFEGSVLNFEIKKSEKAFEIPLSNVSHTTTAKNEVTLEFHQNDDAPVSLMEMRFHIPSVDGVDPVQAFMEQVLQKASIIREIGECIAEFKELQCLTPRGRYDIKIFPTFIQLHGKTFDYKIPITSVLRLFQLPHKDSRQVFFVLSLDPPIKQGQTRYHFLILLFNKDEDLNIELGLSESEIREKYEGKLSKIMTGPVYEIVSKVMRHTIQRKITTPDASFATKDTPAITCSYRASNGLMYPLDRGFIYLHKPPVHIRFDEISSINFARSGGSTRSFDFEIETKSSIIHTFSSIDKEEYAKLFDFVSTKKLRVKNVGTEAPKDKKSVHDDDLIDSDLSEDEPDAYLQRVREEGRVRDELGDSDESDESFNPGQEEDEVAEEFDSNVSDSSDEDDDDEGSHHGSGHSKKRKIKSKKSRDDSGREKTKKKSKGNDDGKPKRPQSAFFLWMNESREQIKKDFPNLTLTEVSKKAGDLWKEVKDKSKWEEMASKAKKVYEREMAEFKASGGGGGNNSGDKKPKKSNSETKKPSKSSSSPIKSSQGQFKSKEYITSEESSSSSSNDDSDS